jgi:hypothetical protein
MKRRWILRGLRMLAVAAVAVGGAAWLVMSLWNFVLPAAAGLHAISFGQALALLVLSRILFGGLRRHAGGWQWRRRLRQRWDRMTPEERERVRASAASCCGPSGARQGT